MEVDDNQCNFTALDSTSGQKRKLDETSGGGGGGPVDLTGGGRFYGWPSSRIVRVSRASGGKDRHSKVLTSKGLRDRRVRLSVNTAIQFYDLQDRLGYDQPSKAVEWLLKAAASSITELPPMTMPFPETPKENNNYSSHCQQMTKSNACSSNSETSKGSAVLSLSRSDSLVAASEKVKSENPISQTFTELLNAMGGSSNVDNSNTASPDGAAAGNGGVNETNYFEKSPPGNWSSSAPMDYFSGLFGAVNPVVRPPVFTLEQQHHHHPELQQFSIVPEQLIIPVAARGNHNEYNLNFKISSGSSSGLSSFPRGTLQSNSTSSSTPSSLFPQFQRLPPVDSSSVPSYYIGTVENHNQFLLQLCFDPQADNNGRQSNQKGKGKN